MQHKFIYNLHSFTQCQLFALNLGPIYNTRQIYSIYTWVVHRLNKDNLFKFHKHDASQPKDQATQVSTKIYINHY